MSVLLELQQDFAAALLDAERIFPEDVTSHSTRHPTRHPACRFNVYRNNVVVSLIDVLKAYFPVVTRLLGEEFFCATARAYGMAAPA